MRNVLRVLMVSVLVNLSLALIKLMAGVFGGSSAMISDAFHSMADTFGVIIIIVGVKLAGGDKRGASGHERLEFISAVVMSAFLFFTGLLIGWVGLKALISGAGDTPEIRGALPMITAVAAVFVKEVMFRYANNQAKLLNSKALLAEAWHHRSDSLSSIGSFVGAAGAWMGAAWLDPLAGIVISLLIIKVAVEILRESLGKPIRKAVNKVVD